MPGDLYTTLTFISLSPLSLAEKNDQCDTRCKWSLTRNPERRWWYRHISIKFFHHSPWLQGTGMEFFIYNTSNFQELNQVRGMCWSIVVPSFSLQWKSDESTEHYLTQTLLNINWRYCQAGENSHINMNVQGHLMQTRFIEIHRVLTK